MGNIWSYFFPEPEPANSIEHIEENVTEAKEQEKSEVEAPALVPDEALSSAPMVRYLSILNICFW